MDPVKIHFDMETQDPDDVMTAAILATHPAVELTGVSLTPGTPHQVGLVRHVLRILGNSAPVGGKSSEVEELSSSRAVSHFHYKWLGDIPPETPEYTNEEVILSSCEQGATLLTGAPLHNLESLPQFHRWVGQGCFAGDSVVPVANRLPQFAGKETCPTFNFNGNSIVAIDMLKYFDGDIYLVSKNVCHGVFWDQEFHKRVGELTNRTKGLDLVFQGMSLYLKKNPDGKKLHDPLAMAVAIRPKVCTFRRVEAYRAKNGEWGTKLSLNSNTQISISVDREEFFRTLTEGEPESIWSRL